ncbi:hypothetical protein AB0I28_33035 [Phytomonospora sp. NPDC050363]|uniref:hypothetical protein n=1 Tax=Phytomonospora sp. NPDC050363 TaxID=3155642 RepID=UPI0033EFBB68
MKKYSKLARNHVELNHPEEFQQIRDSEAYFLRIGEDMAHQIEKRTSQLLKTTDLPQQTFIERLEAETTLRFQAEQEILRAYLT